MSKGKTPTTQEAQVPEYLQSLFTEYATAIYSLYRPNGRWIQSRPTEAVSGDKRTI